MTPLWVPAPPKLIVPAPPAIIRPAPLVTPRSRLDELLFAGVAPFAKKKGQGRYAPSGGGGGGDGSEPVYMAAPGSVSLAVINMDSYANIGQWDAAYGPNRYWSGAGEVAIPVASVCSLVTGQGGTGQAVRMRYGDAYASEVFWGPEGWTTGYSQFFFQCYIRIDPTGDIASADGSGIKGFMFWGSGGRYEFAFNRLHHGADAQTRWLKPFNPSNAQAQVLSGRAFNVWKTSDGLAPLLSASAHASTFRRVTFELNTGTDISASQRGVRSWLDGVLQYDDIGIDVKTGFSAGGGYDYTEAGKVRYFKLLGNTPVAASAPATPADFDIDSIYCWARLP